MNETSVNDAVLPELNLYTEIATSRIYEGKLFDGFVIVRPLIPPFSKYIRKIDVVRFSQEFDDFQGDRRDIRDFLNGYVQSRVEETAVETEVGEAGSVDPTPPETIQ